MIRYTHMLFSNHEKINLVEKFSEFDDFWHPRIVVELNG